MPAADAKTPAAMTVGVKDAKMVSGVVIAGSGQRHRPGPDRAVRTLELER